MSQTVGNNSQKITRDRQVTRQRILAAVDAVIERDGFRGLGVNAVAREAGFDKVLIYRYFGGLEGLLREYGETFDFWPSAEEMVGGDLERLKTLPPADRLAAILLNFAKCLRDRPKTLELLAWETVEESELTRILSRIRQEQQLEFISELSDGFDDLDVDLVALIALLGGGLNYLLLRCRKNNSFGGIDIMTDEGWERVESMMRGMIANAIQS